MDNIFEKPIKSSTIEKIKEIIQNPNEYQWFQNGDHPDDEYKPSFDEGKVVRRFRSPDIDGFSTCNKCNYYFHDHGWIDSGGEGQLVCPGDYIKKIDGKYYNISKE